MQLTTEKLEELFEAYSSHAMEAVAQNSDEMVKDELATQAALRESEKIGDLVCCAVIGCNILGIRSLMVAMFHCGVAWAEVRMLEGIEKES